MKKKLLFSCFVMRKKSSCTNIKYKFFSLFIFEIVEFDIFSTVEEEVLSKKFSKDEKNCHFFLNVLSYVGRPGP